MRRAFTSNKQLTQLARDLGIKNWQQLTQFIQNLPYGRNSNRNDFSLVISESKGTCSSKHALLKAIALENNWEDIHLILGMYKMSEENTPGIGSVLAETPIPFLPEAHCYLMINSVRKDLTSSQADIANIENDLLREVEILPHQVSEYKIAYHKDYLMDWIEKENIPLSFDDIWELREQCIFNLSQ